MDDEIGAGDQVEQRKTGKRGKVIIGLFRADAKWGHPPDWPAGERMAWVLWDGDQERTAVPIADLVKRQQP